MARPRAFDPDAVLGAALAVFWERGYRATSFDDITRATGVNKPSLYAAYGDKPALFRRVLERYHETLLAHAKSMLERPGSARQAIEDWLTSFLPSCTGAAGGRGCLSVNASLEAATVDDPDVTKAIKGYNRKIEKLLAATIRRGMAEKELSPKLDAAAAARLLLTTQTGLMVLARDRPDAKSTRATMMHALRALDR